MFDISTWIHIPFEKCIYPGESVMSLAVGGRYVIWLDNKLKGKWKQVYYKGLYFELEEDAVLYKLTWA